MKTQRLFAGGQLVELKIHLPLETVGWLTDAASRFGVSRSEIVQRAVERYLGQMDEIRDQYESRRGVREHDLDWGRARRTVRRANCYYENCPFAIDCPVEVCPL